jgi:hypothetical protein
MTKKVAGIPRRCRMGRALVYWPAEASSTRGHERVELARGGRAELAVEPSAVRWKSGFLAEI